MRPVFACCLLYVLLVSCSCFAQAKKPPIMGWSSWNNFRVNINEQLVQEEADALVSSGMYDAGYRFVNIDDGYFGGRDSSGNLFVNAKKFPSGMASLVNYIHGKNLKAGIYTDAGSNTCGSIYDRDSLGRGAGIYGHIQQDCHLFFKVWKFDFLKVDWCGGQRMKLDEETEYSKIITAVKAIDSNILFNVCRWQFPGTWVIKKADSWRVSGDIQDKFSSILRIIDLNAPLYIYSSPGHYNDMDMLQVGRGMNYEEDKSHFSMWCLMNSPLLAGNDLRFMSRQTIEILTNKEMIALNQDPAFVQARKIFSKDGVDLWLKPLAGHGKNAVAILNRNDKDVTYDLEVEKLNINKKARARDLWLHKNLGKIGKKKSFVIPAHGIIVLRTDE